MQRRILVVIVQTGYECQLCRSVCTNAQQRWMGGLTCVHRRMSCLFHRQVYRQFWDRWSGHRDSLHLEAEPAAAS